MYNKTIPTTIKSIAPVFGRIKLSLVSPPTNKPVILSPISTINGCNAPIDETIVAGNSFIAKNNVTIPPKERSALTISKRKLCNSFQKSFLILELKRPHNNVNSVTT